MNSDVGLWSISNRIYHVVGRLTVPFESIEKIQVFCSCSVHGSIISFYVPVCKLLSSLVKRMVVKCWKTLPTHTQLKMNMDIKPDVFVDLLVLDMYSYAAMLPGSVQSITKKLDLHQTHTSSNTYIKTTSPDQTKTKCPPPPPKKKRKNSMYIYKYLYNYIYILNTLVSKCLLCPHFFLYRFVVGRTRS